MFHRNIAYTVSEMLAQIDHKGPNLTFLTLKMTFRVTSDLSYLLGQDSFHIGQHLVTTEYP